jgi:SAM-dependent methyltransferase
LLFDVAASRVQTANSLGTPEAPAARSAPYREENLLDRLSSDSAREAHYRNLRERESRLLLKRLGIARGAVLEVGCGWHPARDLFPSPAFRLVAVDADPACAAHALESGQADEAFVGNAGRLELDPGSFDVVLYRLVLHHVAYQGPLDPCFAEAALALRPGGRLVAIEPGLWHPIGLGLALANYLGLATAVHGTPDDLPLSPRGLTAAARAAGLRAELHAITYTWRRLPARVQRVLQPFDKLGSRPKIARFGHTLMLIASKPIEAT